MNTTRLKVAVLGFGKVARHVIENPYFSTLADLSLIVTRNPDRIPQEIRASVECTTDLGRCLGEHIDVVIELMGGLSPTENVLRSALNAGKHVVTANRRLVALRGSELVGLAAARGRSFLYEATVGNGLPVLRSARLLMSVRPQVVVCMLNATSNIILGRMLSADGDLQSAIEACRSMGIYEASVDDDLNGLDTAEKLHILSELLCQQRLPFERLRPVSVGVLDGVPVRPLIDAGLTIKYLGVLTFDDHDRLSIEVGPFLVRARSALGALTGVANYIRFEYPNGSNISFAGSSVDPQSTSMSVLNDLDLIVGNQRDWAQLSLDMKRSSLVVGWPNAVSIDATSIVGLRSLLHLENF